MEAIRLKSHILGLSVPPSAYPICALVRCEQKVVALWHESAENRLELIDNKMSAIVCGCTRDGRVVIADGQRFEVYTRKQRHFELTGKGTHQLKNPLAILPAQQPGQLLVCCGDGKIELMNLP